MGRKRTIDQSLDIADQFLGVMFDKAIPGQYLAMRQPAARYEGAVVGQDKGLGRGRSLIDGEDS
ncbi:hypothetical protein GCM10007874_37600 [Labrys miyagiensis]|uniref:Uncharacterized protein n=1 Tax=Labrys miyagiensis TaxID=346912 RepID=A0ABQ6CKB7_9HYPH|nr:hypothetical protein GCM10007874_37600 [Labrys miyagiensis]